MKKIRKYLSSGKGRRAGYRVLSTLGVAAVFGMAFVLTLSAIDIKPGAEKLAALELVERDGSYQVETDGFVTTLKVENIGNSRLADKLSLIHI